MSLERVSLRNVPLGLDGNSNNIMNSDGNVDMGDANHEDGYAARGDAVMRDLMTDAAAVGRVQAENRHPTIQW